MAQPKTTQIIAKSQWYTIYREIDEDAVRLIAKYVDRFDASVYAMRVTEISRDGLLRMYAKWDVPETKGERLIAAVRLQPETAAQWRSRMLSVETIKDFERLMWELDEAYVINQAKE